MRKMMRKLEDMDKFELALLVIVVVAIAVFIGMMVVVVIGLCNGATFSGSASTAITNMHTVIRMTCY